MKIIKILCKIWDFIAHVAWLITKMDELFDQVKIFWEYLFSDDENEPEDEGKSA